MDASQASPTQKNDERDYENHFANEPQHDDSPIPDTQLDFENGASDTQHDVTRAESDHILFAPLSFHEPQANSQKTDIDIEPSSPPPGPGPSLSNSRRGWNPRTSSSQHHSSLQRPETQTPFRQSHPAPETPAAVNNPFAGNAMFAGQAIAASQLFGQTQQSSPFKGAFSPTSSRPSPAVMVQQAISPNLAQLPFHDDYNISPPTVVRSNGRHVPTSVARDNSSFANQETPAPARWRGHTVQDTPSAAIGRNTQRQHEPMAHYESMKESQERRKRDRTESQEQNSGFDDSDDEEAAVIVKRRRVNKIKASVSRDLANISLRQSEPMLRGDVEVPGTTQKDLHAPGRRRPPMVEVFEEADEDEISTVADSQEPLPAAPRLGTLTTVPQSPDRQLPIPVVDTGYGSSNERIPDSTACTRAEEPDDQPEGSATQPASPEVDMIPETSPLRQSAAGKETEASRSSPVEPPQPSQRNHDTFDRLPEPEPSRRSSRVVRPTAKSSEAAEPKTSTSKKGRKETRAKSKTPADREENKLYSDVSVIPESSPRLPPRKSLADLPSSPPARLTAVPASLTQTPTEPRTPSVPQSTAPPIMSATSSSLSSLSSMTDPSAMSMPSTQEASLADTPQSRPELPQLRTALDGLRGSNSRNRRSVRNLRRGSTSTDELARSSTPIGFENSIIKPAKKAVSRGNRTAIHAHGDKLFTGMAFAVSFQSKRPGENEDAFQRRLDLSKDIEGMILDGGGRLLTDGFLELFDSATLQTMATRPAAEDDDDTPNSSLNLAADSRALGFTALIADGHSRKVKYMQALALGLPCISDRWITDCIGKRAILDWSPYLLCAGQSTFLRGAVRSRILTPYPAAEARLVDVIEQRAQLLAGSKILLVMKKSRQEEKKMMYVFVTHVLGASLRRAYGITEAQDMMLDRQLRGSPYDLVYIDENTGTEAALFKKNATRLGPRGRPIREPLPIKVRTLTDELVIQSLILGRMIERDEEEM